MGGRALSSFLLIPLRLPLHYGAKPANVHIAVHHVELVKMKPACAVDFPAVPRCRRQLLLELVEEIGADGKLVEPEVLEGRVDSSLLL